MSHKMCPKAPKTTSACHCEFSLKTIAALFLNLVERSFTITEERYYRKLYSGIRDEE